MNPAARWGAGCANGRISGAECEYYSRVKIDLSGADSPPLHVPPNRIMILYLMRHANAGAFRGNPILDAKRGLVKEGKEQCVLMARMLGALKVQVDVIVSSPLKRCQQTAQFVGTELGYEAKVEVSPALAPGGSYTDFQALLAAYADREGVLAVGHNPNVFQFLGRLITGNGGASIRMRKGSIARVDMHRHPPRLQWVIDPRSARQIYASAMKSSRPKTSRK
jgi:phosphohistidine phosphatase